jgi:mono/diheme cytochrome c family protein
MKTTKLKIAFTITISLLLLMPLISSCKKSEKQKKNNDTIQHQEEGVEHQEHGNTHMMQMQETKQWLKQELGAKYEEPVPKATAVQLTKGKEIFITYCASCHGKEGKGDGQAAASLQPKPADFTDPAHASFYSDQGRIHVIKKGIKGTAMIGWENTLKEQEILAVYGYVNSLKIP